MAAFPVADIFSLINLTTTYLTIYFFYRLHRCYSKKNKAYSVYKEKIPKTYRYIPTLQERLLQSVFNRTEPVSAPIQLTPSDPRKITKRLSGISPPSSKRLMELKRSRFSQSKISLSDVFQSGSTDN